MLIRITPPLPEVHILRPPINLGLVLDRSGSMASGSKMEHARQAAIFAVRQLLPTDRVSVTVFDETIETIAASAPVTDKPALVARIRRIGPRGSTALHGGWAAGAQQVLEHVAWQSLNRVLLLSDGIANVGLTDPGAVCAEVRGMAGREVSTSTIGVGSDYNEALLGAMALAGAGNYYYVESAVQLPDIFQTELQGLMATTGRNAELSVRTEPGVVLTEVLTELERGPSSQIRLPDLISDMPISIVVRLRVEPQPHARELCRFYLAWDATGEGPPGRHECDLGLSLPTVTVQEWENLPLDAAVQEQLTLLTATKARDEFHEALQRGEMATAQAILDRVRKLISTAPETAETRAEIANWTATEELFKLGQFGSSSKMAH